MITTNFVKRLGQETQRQKELNTKLVTLLILIDKLELDEN
jgi:hypothetical protein